MSRALAKECGLAVEYKAQAFAIAPVAGEMHSYKNSYTLVVGINSFGCEWPRLSKARGDAQKVTAALEKQRFEVPLTLDRKIVNLGARLAPVFSSKGMTAPNPSVRRTASDPTPRPSAYNLGSASPGHFGPSSFKPIFCGLIFLPLGSSAIMMTSGLGIPFASKGGVGLASFRDKTDRI